MNAGRLVSARFPYIPLVLTFDGSPVELEALLDTGFDGDIVVPADFPCFGTASANSVPGRLADGSRVLLRSYWGSARVAQREIAPVAVFALGDHVLIGTNLIRHLTVILDHGERVIVEP